jgi:hypothetical protein
VLKWLVGLRRVRVDGRDARAGTVATADVVGLAAAGAGCMLDCTCEFRVFGRASKPSTARVIGETDMWSEL